MGNSIKFGLALTDSRGLAPDVKPKHAVVEKPSSLPRMRAEFLGRSMPRRSRGRLANSHHQENVIPSHSRLTRVPLALAPFARAPRPSYDKGVLPGDRELRVL